MPIKTTPSASRANTMPCSGAETKAAPAAAAANTRNHVKTLFQPCQMVSRSITAQSVRSTARASPWRRPICTRIRSLVPGPILSRSASAARRRPLTSLAPCPLRPSMRAFNAPLCSKYARRATTASSCASTPRARRRPCVARASSCCAAKMHSRRRFRAPSRSTVSQTTARSSS